MRLALHGEACALDHKCEEEPSEQLLEFRAGFDGDGAVGREGRLRRRYPSYSRTQSFDEGSGWPVWSVMSSSCAGHGTILGKSYAKGRKGHRSYRVPSNFA